MQKDLGGLPPEQALDYMEKTPGSRDRECRGTRFLGSEPL